MVLDGFRHGFDTFLEHVFDDFLPPSQNFPLIILRILRHLNSSYFEFFDFHMFKYFSYFFNQGSVAVAVAFKFTV